MGTGRPAAQAEFTEVYDRAGGVAGLAPTTPPAPGVAGAPLTRGYLSQNSTSQAVLRAALAPGAGRLAPARPPAGSGAPTESPAPDDGHNTEGYDRIFENPFLAVGDNPLSTFSIDVDTASYANVRRFLTGNMLPPPDAVRLEELVNYFPYDYAAPTDAKTPFAVHLEVASCPWQSKHRLIRVGMKGREIDLARRPPSNLVFLLDVSGSMSDPNKLPLLQSALGLLVNQLTENDRVSMVVYAGASGVVLPPTAGDRKQEILGALERLHAGGSTNGASGISLAYDTARAGFISGGTNRVILATDGDFNVGLTSRGDLLRLIEDKAKSGIFLTVLGFGMGNYKDDMLERLADKGNGNYAYVDSLNEARKVMVEQMAGTLITIAKDVKVQIEFNPARVSAYRLLGYENRLLAKEDFNDDRKDAGEIGAGHTVTALYEIVPAGVALPAGAAASVDPLKYAPQPAAAAAPAPAPGAGSGETCTVKLRYKQPDGDTSALMTFPLSDADNAFDRATGDFRFAAAVAGYGMLLRHSEHAAGLTWDAITEIAGSSLGADRTGYRKEFLELARKAKALAAQK
ncbi:MAG: VWA domain-containing protein [Planctomycetes bacterium]|nr:VWA domain-containing protein [Planctomycetota bacterium]